LENVADALLALLRDADVADVFYRLENDDFTYSSEFRGSKDERSLDRLLTLFDFLAKRRRLGLVQVTDLESVAYHYLVVCQNPEVQSYLRFLDEWFAERRFLVRPYRDFRETGAQLARRVSSTTGGADSPRILG
jgi:hypothetical protein